MQQIIRLFPIHMRDNLAKSGVFERDLEEIRVRVNEYLMFLTARGELFLRGTELVRKTDAACCRMGRADVDQMCTFMSNYSLYAYEEEMRQGFLTVEGGHRIGICGQVSVENGHIRRIYPVSYLNIRIASEHRGCAEGVFRFLHRDNGFYNTLRFTEKTDRIAHIPKVLYHWRVREESTAGSQMAKPYILDAAKKAKEDALARRGLTGEVELIEGIYQYRVNYLPAVWPKISVIIPSRDNYKVLDRCLSSFHEMTDYPDFEIILVDNGSTDENRGRYQQLSDQYHMTYLYQKEMFNFSHMCNLGSEAATGDYLLFLNDDIEIIEQNWLKRMVGQASLPHTGAVGAKLLYPDRRTIQHAGVINILNGPCHALAGNSDEVIYYFGKNRLDYNQMAVTAACLLVKKTRFEEVSGFDEELAVAYNDVELCFHLLTKGYYHVIRNDAVLIHHESVSRGNDLEDSEKLDRLMREQEKLYEKYPQFRGKDSFYSPNLAQHRVDFSLNLD